MAGIGSINSFEKNISLKFFKIVFSISLSFPMQNSVTLHLKKLEFPLYKNASGEEM